MDLSYFRIRVGSSTVDDGGYLHEIEKVVIHPRHKVLTYNLAVVKLSTPVTFSDKVQAIQMKEQGEEVADGENVRITGWGMNEVRFILIFFFSCGWYGKFNIRLFASIRYVF